MISFRTQKKRNSLLRLESRLYGTMNGSWDAYLASPADFAGADDIITNLAKEREPEFEIIERTAKYLIITSLEILHRFFQIQLKPIWRRGTKVLKRPASLHYVHNLMHFLTLPRPLFAPSSRKGNDSVPRRLTEKYKISDRKLTPAKTDTLRNKNCFL